MTSFGPSPGYRNPTSDRPRGWRTYAEFGGGPMRDWGAHLFDQAVQLAGPAPLSVFARRAVPAGLGRGDGGHGLAALPPGAGRGRRGAEGLRYGIETGSISALPEARAGSCGAPKGPTSSTGRDPQEAALHRGEVGPRVMDAEHAPKVVRYVDGEVREVAVEQVPGDYAGVLRQRRGRDPGGARPGGGAGERAALHPAPPGGVPLASAGPARRRRPGRPGRPGRADLDPSLPRRQEQEHSVSRGACTSCATTPGPERPIAAGTGQQRAAAHRAPAGKERAGGRVPAPGRPGRSGAGGYGAGNPILFPFPNRVRGGRYSFEGQAYQLDVNETAPGNHIHGLVAQAPWKVEGAGASDRAGRLAAGLDRPAADPECARQYPFPCPPDGDHPAARTASLVQAVEAPQHGPGRLPMGFGTHPWFPAALGGGSREATQVRVPGNRYWELENLVPTGRDGGGAESTPGSSTCGSGRRWTATRTTTSLPTWCAARTAGARRGSVTRRRAGARGGGQPGVPGVGDLRPHDAPGGVPGAVHRDDGRRKSAAPGSGRGAGGARPWRVLDGDDPHLTARSQVVAHQHPRRGPGTWDVRL